MLIGLSQEAANFLWHTEIKRCSLYGQNLSCWHTLSAVFKILRCIYLQNVMKRCSTAIKVPIAVVREIADCILITNRIVGNVECIVFHAIGHADVQISGISLFTVWRHTRKSHTITQDFGTPNILIKATQTTMQMISAVIARQYIRFSVQRKLRVSNAICHTTNTRTKISSMCLITINRIIAKHDIHPVSISIFYQNGLYGCTVVQRPYN